MAEASWAQMTADERRAWRISQWRNPGLPFANPEAEAEYRARVDRILAAINLEKPDRVPVCLIGGFWGASWAGLTPYDVMSDPAKAAKAWTDFNLEFRLDTQCSPLFAAVSAPMLENLDYRSYSWPGHGVTKEASFQYNERQWMLAEEYDHLIADPSDYLLRVYLPRAVGAFGGFANLSSFCDFIEMPFSSFHMPGWGSPEMIEGLERLAAASRSVGEWWQHMGGMVGGLMAAGFPGYFAGGSKAPFDILGDTLRGTKEVIMDMFRRPDKVLAACERLVPVAINWALKRPGQLGSPVIFLPLHKGADGFMSDEQFNTFYWPTLRAVILGLIEEGCIPFMFAEGHYNQRLEAIMDLPKGTTVWLFDQTDMARAKQTIGKVACIQGNVPLSLMYAGTPQETEEYCRKLVDTVGEGGGFILDTGAVADGGKAENLRAMIRTAQEYGRY
ncbi:MAG: uroporphyrinogen decarboxylase [Actinobacteria bacterium]|nr:uroporphyrinogen decarboxylase [Actinomycetota bacterium]